MRLLFCVALSALMGCSAAKPKQVGEVDRNPVVADPDPIGEPVDEPEPNDDPDPEPKPKKESYTGSDDYEINHRDCQALSGAYGRAWLNDEIKKLNDKKLKTAQHDKLQEGLESDSQAMADQYRGECDKTVGTAYLRPRLVCAMKAKSMQRFDDCMAGTTDTN